MIDRKALLDDLKKLVTKLEKDLRERCEENAEVDARVRIEYEKAKEAKRTAQAYKVWRDEWITQVAVAWVLGVVFVRFIEDNGLIAAPFIAGPGERLQFAKEQRTAFFQQNPTQSDREYLEHVFREVAKLPAMKELYDEQHNPLWALGVSGDGAKLILEQFQKIDPGTGDLVHDFTDPEWGTRFLGDLYQDLSEAARKKYALLQTPEFVEEFILDRTLDPAIAEFGLESVRMIDPTCGSGHFLLGGFARLFRLWETREPATTRTVLAQRSLNAVYGVDLNPYAVAISRFRLLLAAMKASGIDRLAAAPGYRINLAAGDSLVHGPRFTATAGVQAALDPADDPLRHVYATEDRDDLRRILGQQYHSVVGNPPYITVKDKALNEAYRQKFGSCHRQYSLSVPFMERFFDLALSESSSYGAGFTGQITANSFMRREFGSKLVESYIPNWDITHVVDTSGAHIPGHETPTVILFGRNRLPSAETIRTVLGIRGEPSTPEDPARGEVWSAIRAQVDQPGSTSRYVSVSDMARDVFRRHPWSLGGGGAAELKEHIRSLSERTLADVAALIGAIAVTREDDVYFISGPAARRHRIPEEHIRSLVAGADVRDWSIVNPTEGIWPYDASTLAATPSEPVLRFLWPYKRQLSDRVAFGVTQVERGLQWFEYSMFFKDRFQTGTTIAFPLVATHNHFVLHRGDNVFTHGAPVIKFSKDTPHEEVFAVLALLNSSTACFWARQTLFAKGGFAAGKWEERLEWDATKLMTFPVVAGGSAELAREVESLIVQRSGAEPAEQLRLDPAEWNFEAAAIQSEDLLRRAVSVQEELDWMSYRLYGLISDDLNYDPPPPIAKGERAFEILLARTLSAGGEGKGWFERHGIDPQLEIPQTWPQGYRRVVERRIELIQRDANLRLIEQPEHKRRWHEESWEVRFGVAVRDFLSERLESLAAPASSITSSACLAAHCAADVIFVSAAESYRGSVDFDVNALVGELATDFAVPALPIDRYKESGIRNRAAWEKTWALQRRQDAGEARDVPLPPKYKSTDFRSPVYWSLRGKLDVPKERFISFPGCERDSDPSLPLLWAGLDHLQQAKAVAAYYQDLKDNEAAAPTKLGKLLACILELLPWLKQWHNEIDPEYGTRMGDFFESFMHAEMASLGLTMDDLRRIRGL